MSPEDELFFIELDFLVIDLCDMPLCMLPFELVLPMLLPDMDPDEPMELDELPIWADAAAASASDAAQARAVLIMLLSQGCKLRNSELVPIAALRASPHRGYGPIKNMIAR